MTSNFPIVEPPIADKLTFLLPWAVGCTQEEQKGYLRPVVDRVERLITRGLCKKAYIEHSRYLRKIIIPLSSGADALVQIGARDPIRQKGGISVAINPSKLSPASTKKFHEVMAHLIGDEYIELIKTPLLNRVDFAVDVLNVDIENLLVRYSRNRRHTIFGKRVVKGGRVESYNFGSVKSDYITCVYDKSTEMVEKALANLLRHGHEQDILRENSVESFVRERDGAKVVRVEARAVKLRGCRPYELWSLPNRFERLCFADLMIEEGAALSEFDRQALLALCRQHGVSAALDLYKRERPDVPVREFWESRRAGWWNPKTVWGDACSALRESGIFPKCAFVKPETHTSMRALSKEMYLAP
ncbi:hypothetical protein KDW41_00045 [Burkholderia vietnamiensis]|uniref:hypothetical protein n=1 Tax=Burkholderia vietnamiensis TaxID=60552 RepID=UPI001B9FF595|nr:hypothetical protein [Burkholderia vietnamiensis]MBR7958840.1 hypothetical protein [Burkholderia vietnamiensis]MBR7973816.1 hypothetical protein [Burkholderia vietnamiensis]MBR8359382.1 hypothetical protein [Burkholderia vietnamiensis]MDN8041787.1 hypothetical protein [Burkholderia vietnamiensis]